MGLEKKILKNAEGGAEYEFISSALEKLRERLVVTRHLPHYNRAGTLLGSPILNPDFHRPWRLFHDCCYVIGASKRNLNLGGCFSLDSKSASDFASANFAPKVAGALDLDHGDPHYLGARGVEVDVVGHDPKEEDHHNQQGRSNDFGFHITLFVRVLVGAQAVRLAIATRVPTSTNPTASVSSGLDTVRWLSVVLGAT